VFSFLFGEVVKLACYLKLIAIVICTLSDDNELVLAFAIELPDNAVNDSVIKLKVDDLFSFILERFYTVVIASPATGTAQQTIRALVLIEVTNETTFVTMRAD
jgi:hypothetical protein